MGCNPTGIFEVCFLWPHRIILTLVSGFTVKRRVTMKRPQIERSNRYRQSGISTSNMVRVKEGVPKVFVKGSADSGYADTSGVFCRSE